MGNDAGDIGPGLYELSDFAPSPAVDEDEDDGEEPVRAVRVVLGMAAGGRSGKDESSVWAAKGDGLPGMSVEGAGVGRPLRADGEVVVCVILRGLGSGVLSSNG